MAIIQGNDKCYVDTKKEPIWWYHPDHLGSSSYLSDYSGLPSHYYNYLPFGEEMVAQNTSAYDNKYRFSGKELDEETGLSYFGARYYNPKWSIWLGVDPEFAKFPNWSPYNYCMQNPIKLIDPNGMSPVEGDPNKRTLISTTAQSDLTVEFKPGKTSTDGNEIVTLKTQYNSRYEEIDENGNKSEIFTQTIYTHTATVDIEGNISNVSESQSYIEENSKGERLKNTIYNTTYNINSEKSNEYTLKDFKTIVLGVSNHRKSEKMSLAQHGLDMLNNGNTYMGLAGTLIGSMGLISNSPYAKAAGVISAGLGYFGTMITLALTDTKPKDIIFNFTYQNSMKSNSSSYPIFKSLFSKK